MMDHDNEPFIKSGREDTKVKIIIKTTLYGGIHDVFLQQYVPVWKLYSSVKELSSLILGSFDIIAVTNGSRVNLIPSGKIVSMKNVEVEVTDSIVSPRNLIGKWLEYRTLDDKGDDVISAAHITDDLQGCKLLIDTGLEKIDLHYLSRNIAPIGTCVKSDITNKKVYYKGSYVVWQMFLTEVDGKAASAYDYFFTKSKRDYFSYPGPSDVVQLRNWSVSDDNIKVWMEGKTSEFDTETCDPSELHNLIKLLDVTKDNDLTILFIRFVDFLSDRFYGSTMRAERQVPYENSSPAPCEEVSNYHEGTLLAMIKMIEIDLDNSLKLPSGFYPNIPYLRNNKSLTFSYSLKDISSGTPHILETNFFSKFAVIEKFIDKYEFDCDLSTRRYIRRLRFHCERLKEENLDWVEIITLQENRFYSLARRLLSDGHNDISMIDDVALNTFRNLTFNPKATKEQLEETRDISSLFLTVLLAGNCTSGVDLSIPFGEREVLLCLRNEHIVTRLGRLAVGIDNLRSERAFQQREYIRVKQYLDITPEFLEREHEFVSLYRYATGHSSIKFASFTQHLLSLSDRHGSCKTLGDILLVDIKEERNTHVKDTKRQLLEINKCVCGVLQGMSTIKPVGDIIQQIKLLNRFCELYEGSMMKELNSGSSLVVSCLREFYTGHPILRADLISDLVPNFEDQSSSKLFKYSEVVKRESTTTDDAYFCLLLRCLLDGFSEVAPFPDNLNRLKSKADNLRPDFEVCSSNEENIVAKTFYNCFHPPEPLLTTFRPFVAKVGIDMNEMFSMNMLDDIPLLVARRIQLQLSYWKCGDCDSKVFKWFEAVSELHEEMFQRELPKVEVPPVEFKNDLRELSCDSAALLTVTSDVITIRKYLNEFIDCWSINATETPINTFEEKVVTVLGQKNDQLVNDICYKMDSYFVENDSLKWIIGSSKAGNESLEEYMASESERVSELDPRKNGKLYNPETRSNFDIAIAGRSRELIRRGETKEKTKELEESSWNVIENLMVEGESDRATKIESCLQREGS